MLGTLRLKRIPIPVRVGIVLGLIFIGMASMLVMSTQPTGATFPTSGKTVDPERLRAHVEKLSDDFAPRSYKRIWNLNKCADYIGSHFREAGGVLSNQTYEVKGKTYRNVIATFGPDTATRIVVGAHYDSFQDTPGADDNASGVSGLLELAYLLGKADLKQRVDLVAYTLEEPPFFRSGNMGSARHAYGLRLDEVNVEAMLCLEMIGYFNDQEGSQQFSSAIHNLIYPDTGNFIAIIGSMDDRKLAKEVKVVMRGATELPVHVMCAPKGYPGIDFSDHRNYWNHGYTAIMITDTAFMRNFAYHGSADTADRLDYKRMAHVVLGVYEAVLHLSNDPS